MKLNLRNFLTHTGLFLCFTSTFSAEAGYYAGYKAEVGSEAILSGFALYVDHNQVYSILARRNYLVNGGPFVYPGLLDGKFTDNGRGVLTSKNLVMRFYDDYVDSKHVCEVPITMTLVWNHDRSALRAENVRFPTRYPKNYEIFGCEKLGKSDMTLPLTLSFQKQN